VEIGCEDELTKRRGSSSELDEMWSYVRRKANPYWLWHAIDHHTGKVLAYVFGRRKNDVFLQLKALFEPCGLTRYYTGGWGAYERYVEPDKPTVGKGNTQQIESKHINLRTRIKRLVRRTICFSKPEHMHDLVRGLFINRCEFGRTFETFSTLDLGGVHAQLASHSRGLGAVCRERLSF
jgi:insertion element IS1 protein InsB